MRIFAPTTKRRLEAYNGGIMKIEDLFADYAAYHRTSGNKLFHRLGVPLIVFSLFGMLASVTIIASPRVDAAMLLIGIATIFYLSLDVALAIAMAVTSTILYYLSLYLALPLHVALFVLGWIFQFIGHAVYEKKNPAFAKNLIHLLVGPLWILADAFRISRARASTGNELS